MLCKFLAISKKLLDIFSGSGFMAKKSQSPPPPPPHPIVFQQSYVLDVRVNLVVCAVV